MNNLDGSPPVRNFLEWGKNNDISKARQKIASIGSDSKLNTRRTDTIEQLIEVQ